jgi:hypothetical protein
MCFDVRTSLTTFSIGTIANAHNLYTFSKDYPEVVPVTIVWQWVLMMQVFEAMAWMSQDKKDENGKAASMAMMANVTQPIVTFLVLMLFSESMRSVGMTNKAIATFAVFAYIVWLILQLNKSDKFDELKPKKDCDHLNLGWWDHFDGHSSMYMATLLTVLVLLLRPLEFMSLTTGYIFGTLLLSGLVYSCGTGSMWCWLVAFAPIFTGAYFGLKQL